MEAYTVSSLLWATHQEDEGTGMETSICLYAQPEL
jgi:hypothetical protein